MRRLAFLAFVGALAMAQSRPVQVVAPKTPHVYLYSATTDGGRGLNVVEMGGAAALGSVAIQRGAIPGASWVQKFGRNNDIDTGTVPEDVWNGGGIYTGQPVSADGGATAQTLEVYSSSALDDADDGGTGAWTVLLVGLSETYAPQEETVTLNGTIPVVTDAGFGRMFRAIVQTGGTNGVNAGSITARHSTTTANIFAVMPVGSGQTQIACYTIPTGKVGYLMSVGAESLGGSTSELTTAIVTRTPGGVWRKQRPYDLEATTTISDDIAGGLPLAARTDICWRVTASAAINVSLNAHFEILLMDAL